jgi:uncharacterized membrane protein
VSTGVAGVLGGVVIISPVDYIFLSYASHLYFLISYVLLVVSLVLVFLQTI